MVRLETSFPDAASTLTLPTLIRGPVRRPSACQRQPRVREAPCSPVRGEPDDGAGRLAHLRSRQKPAASSRYAWAPRGGVRVAQDDPLRFADILAMQLQLVGVERGVAVRLPP